MIKRFLFFNFLVFCAGKWASQNLNIAHHTYVDNALSLVSINAKCYYLEKITYGCCSERANVVALNDSGNIYLKPLSSSPILTGLKS